MKFRLSDLNVNTIKQGVEHLRTTALPQVLSKAKSMVTGMDLAYDRFFRETIEADEEELAKQRKTVFSFAPRISIIVPVYMTPELSLRAMIESVIHQTYENWELCMVDGSQAKGEPPVLDAHIAEDGELTVLEKVYSLETERIIRQYMEGDTRIRYQKMEENKGISGNSNEALAMATGEYVALLDHDDMLTEDALYMVVKALQEQPYDVCYSDEDRMTDNGNYLEPRFKPDFDIDLLRSCNYISHLFVAKRELMIKEGGFLSRFDGAQSYDMILRCCEGKRHICHIARVLYHKRIHEGNSPEREAKHAQENVAGREALEAHVEREHLLASVMMSEERSVYELHYDTPGNPLVSMIVTGYTCKNLMECLLEPLYEKNRYSNFEIIIVDENRTDEALQKYYQMMQSKRRNIVVIQAPDDASVTECRNLGCLRAKGTYLLFLDANTEISEPTSIGEMLGICMRDDVGIVSGALYDEQDVLCCAGVEIAGKYETPVQKWQREMERSMDLSNVQNLYRYPYRGMGKKNPDAAKIMRPDETGAGRYFGMNREYNLTKAGCMLVKKSVFVMLGGFSDKFKTELSSFDFCLRVREHGYRIVNAMHAPWCCHDLPEEVRQARDRKACDVQTERTEQDLFEILWSHLFVLS